MFINAIRFKLYGENTPRVWRFNQGSQKLRNVLCFVESQQTIKDLKTAMCYAFTGSQPGRILEVAIQMTDDASVAWIIERTPERTRIVRNGKVLESQQIGETLLASLLDLDVETAKKLGVDQVFNFFNLRLENEELIAELENKELSALRKVRGSIDRQKRTLLHQSAKLMDQPLFESEDIVLAMRRKAEPLYSANKELLRQRRTLLANAQSLEQVDTRIIDQLEREVELIADIEKTAAPLLDPAQSPKILKEKLSKIEAELSGEMRDCALPEVPEGFDRTPWDKLVSCLSKLEAFERLVQASEKTQQLCRDRIETVQTDYLKTVEQLLAADTQITAELESCLTTLNLQLATRRPEKAGLGDMVIKFIKPSADVPPQESETEKQAKLETARMAVDFALARLGELHANLSNARESFDTIGINMREHHEHIVHEYGKLKALWQRLSKEHKIPTGLTLAELLRLCMRYLNLHELAQSQKRLKELITERRNQLRKLEELILQWRQASESQKDSPLDNPAILVAEAQAIIRYKNAKEGQLEKLRDLREHMRSYNALNANLNQRETQIKQAWRKIFIDLQLPEIAPERAEWPELFGIADQITAWSVLIQNERRSPRSTEVFGLETSDTPISFFHTSADQSNSGFQLQVLQALDRIALEGICLITTTDKELSDILCKHGCGAARLLPPQPNQSSAPRPAPSTAKPQPARAPAAASQDRVQDLLGLLSPKRSGNIER